MHHERNTKRFTHGSPVKAVRGTYHAGLTRHTVVAAAVEMLQQRGVGGFSVRQLATELGVDTMALYKHVRNKDDLLGAAVGQVFHDTRPLGDGEWWEQVRGTFREHRQVIRAQPWVLAVMLSHPLESSEPWEVVDQTLAVLSQHLGAAGAARWMRLLAAFTNGFLQTEPDLVDGPDTRQVESRFPRVTTAAARSARTGDRDFEVGLNALIDAMRAEAASPPPLRKVRTP
ncbi:MAG: transcriptional regulator, TetR family [Frankiales bacterium]|nr:transcriptional regulator, TetR family [Frankiales bacterium]